MLSLIYKKKLGSPRNKNYTLYNVIAFNKYIYPFMVRLLSSFHENYYAINHCSLVQMGFSVYIGRI